MKKILCKSLALAITLMMFQSVGWTSEGGNGSIWSVTENSANGIPVQSATFKYNYASGAAKWDTVSTSKCDAQGRVTSGTNTGAAGTKDYTMTYQHGESAVYHGINADTGKEFTELYVNHGNNLLIYGEGTVGLSVDQAAGEFNKVLNGSKDANLALGDNFQTATMSGQQLSSLMNGGDSGYNTFCNLTGQHGVAKTANSLWNNMVTDIGRLVKGDDTVSPPIPKGGDDVMNRAVCTLSFDKNGMVSQIQTNVTVGRTDVSITTKNNALDSSSSGSSSSSGGTSSSSSSSGGSSSSSSSSGGSSSSSSSSSGGSSSSSSGSSGYGG